MAITLRNTKGSALTHAELDANFTTLDSNLTTLTAEIAAERTATATLTNKTVNLTSNTLTGTKAQFDTACSDGNFLYAAAAASVTTLSASTGVAVGGATAGTGGIAFPATAVAVADPNTLDDYEEGTFTPILQGDSTAGTGTYSTQVGEYTRIGNICHYKIYIIWTHHTGTGTILAGVLPFINTNTLGACSSIYHSNVAMTAGNTMQGYVMANDQYVRLEQVPTGGCASIGVPVDTAGTLMLSGSYRCS
jgi:hypothetical protein